MYVDMPPLLQSADTSAGWNEPGERLLVTGTVYQLDGTTPAPGVIVYYWQTDHKGYYSPGAGMNEKAKRHGHIRGWVKTDTKGRYSIYTSMPAPYPGDKVPAHIHPLVKEPGLPNEYYIDEFVFDNDKYLTSAHRNSLENRGGSGILRLVKKDNVQIAEHDIILGLNIPHYPVTNNPGKISGLQIGEDQPSFIPFHAYGPDKGSRACPVCKYGRYHSVVYFVGNTPDWNEIRAWLKFLDRESITRQKYLKAYFVYGNVAQYNKALRTRELEALGESLKLQQVALTFVPSFTDRESEAHLNKINPDVQNTIVVYRNRNIVAKYIDLKPTKENFRLLSATLERTKGKYFELAAH
jgi:protocatechuate 3,4-dioxygenase beta subunit